MLVDAERDEDAQRLRAWLASPRARRALLEAVEDVLDRLAEGRAV